LAGKHRVPNFVENSGGTADKCGAVLPNLLIQNIRTDSLTLTWFDPDFPKVTTAAIVLVVAPVTSSEANVSTAAATTFHKRAKKIKVSRVSL